MFCFYALAAVYDRFYFDLSIILSYCQVRDILVMYIKNQKLENDADRSCLLIPPSDSIHSILASYSSANKNKQTTAATNPTTTTVGSKGDSKVNSDYDDREFEDSAYNNTTSDMYEGDYLDPLDDNYTGTTATGGSLFGNIPFPGSSGTAEIKMKVHQGGLKSIDHTSTPTNTTTSNDFPALGSTTTKPSTTTSNTTKLGVGGWGVDKGTTWKPVSLSTARANTSLTSGTSTQNTSKTKSSLDTEFPTLGSSLHTTHTSSNKKSSSVSKSVVYSELPTDLIMKKEDVFKAVMKKMSPYFAVISQTGTSIYNSYCFYIELITTCIFPTMIISSKSCLHVENNSSLLYTLAIH